MKKDSEFIIASKEEILEIGKIMLKHNLIGKWDLIMHAEKDDVVYELLKLNYVAKNKLIGVYIFKDGVWGGEIISPTNYATTSEKFFKELGKAPDEILQLMKLNRLN